jgi:hypothetical protein
MRTIILSVLRSVVLSLTLATALPALGTCPSACAEATQSIDRQKVTDHLKQHQTYPATRAELLASCQSLVDFSDAEKQWFAAHLPAGTYKSADEVLKAVFKK